MSKLKVIDLLNKIANGEEAPKKIKRTWVYDDAREKFTYMQKDGTRFDNDWLIEGILNDEVEIIEEEKKIPEKLGIDDISTIDCFTKINEIIDYLESKGE